MDIPETECLARFETFLGNFGRHREGLKRKKVHQDNKPSYPVSILCRQCGDQWTPGRRCEYGQTRSLIRNRLRKGNMHVHILSHAVI